MSIQPGATNPAVATQGGPLLDVRGLRTYFHVMDGTVKAVDGVDFAIPRGGTVGLVGESGCGKSVTAHTIMRLIDIPPGEIAGGEVWFDGRDLLKLSKDKMRLVRGGEIAMIFQEPMTSLNPVFTIGDQISEAILLHNKVNKKEAWDRAIDSLRLVGVSAPERRVKQYPHELSGGMRQRAMIAMSLLFEQLGYTGLQGIYWGILSGVVSALAVELGFEVSKFGSQIVLKKPDTNSLEKESSDKKEKDGS